MSHPLSPSFKAHSDAVCAKLLFCSILQFQKGQDPSRLCPFLLSSSPLPICFVFFLSLSALLLQHHSILLCLLPCCFSLSLFLLAFHSAAVRSFSLSLSPLPLSFVSAWPLSCLFCPFLPLFLFFPSFFFSQVPDKQHICTHSVRASPNHLTSKLILPIYDKCLITNHIYSTATRFSSLFKRYFCFSLLFPFFFFSQASNNQYFCTHFVRASPNHLQTSAFPP